MWSALLNKVGGIGGLQRQLLSDPGEAARAAPAEVAVEETPAVGELDASNVSSEHSSPCKSPARFKSELELDFRKFWELFRSSNSEKEKGRALNAAVDVFCRLVKQQPGEAHLVHKLAETHVLSFVVGRALVTDVDKLKIHSKRGSLHVDDVIGYFSEITEDGTCPGSNLLYAVEVFLREPIDKQPLLDSGILCCLMNILNALLGSDEVSCIQSEAVHKQVQLGGDLADKYTQCLNLLEIEGRIIHIMKALASHRSAMSSLIEDDSLGILFKIVANGCLTAYSLFREGRISLHIIQLHRHAMQILGLLLASDNGSSAQYIQKHHLVKVLLNAIKGYSPDKSDASYAIGIVDLLLGCVELSFRPEAGSIRLREDIHNAHGYQYLVQFSLTLSNLEKNPKYDSLYNDDLLKEGNHNTLETVQNDVQESSSVLSPALLRLLDALISLAQTGSGEVSGIKVLKAHTKGNNQNKRNTKVEDLEAIQMLQDILLKTDNIELQSEVLSRLFRIFSSHTENYKLCQQVRTVPLLILNMADFPQSLQDLILKILEYAVTVVNCVPEQELLSLCYILQQPVTGSLKKLILAFFVKLLSFDRKYKKVLKEVGVLEVLLDDLRQHKLICGAERENMHANNLEGKSDTSKFQKHFDSNGVILSSSKLAGPISAKTLIFEDECTVALGWDCLLNLLKKAGTNQQSFRSSNGSSIILPFLASDSHRAAVLRLLSCLIIEDPQQVHSEELGSLIEILKSGMVSSTSGSQYRLHTDATCDIFAFLWRIMGAHSSAQRVFGEATGFTLLLTTLHSFQSTQQNAAVESCMSTRLKILIYLLRTMTAAVCNNNVNRLRLQALLLSHTFYDLLCETELLSAASEKQVVVLLCELALEVVIPPANELQLKNTLSGEESSFLSPSCFGTSTFERLHLYNASAVVVLIRSLLLFTPETQLDLLTFIETLAMTYTFNQESLTSVGFVGLLLETINPFFDGSSSLLCHALKIVEALGSYRLSPLELRLLVRYILQLKGKHSGDLFVEMMIKLIRLEETRKESFSIAPFIGMDMSKAGNASIQVSLGDRTWPPVSGYSFACWFQFQNLFRSQNSDTAKESKFTGKKNQSGAQVLRIFSVSATDDSSSVYAEVYLEENGIFTLATSNSNSLSFPGTELEEGKWHHLAVVHSKPSALAGLFQASVAQFYLNGRLKHTGKLGYSPSPLGKSLQVTLGTPAVKMNVSTLSWKIRSCYLFEDVLSSGGIFFMYILGHGYRGLFQDMDLLRFVPSQSCGGDTMAILDSLEMELSASSSNQWTDSPIKHGSAGLDGGGIVWDLDRLASLSVQLCGKKFIFAFDGTSADALRVSGTPSLFNLVDPVSAAASPIGGIPRYGRLSGDIYVGNQAAMGCSIQTVGGVAVILALVEAAESRSMLIMALQLLALSLQQNHQNVKDMQTLRGYHLLALFLHRRMPLFDAPCLDILFRIAACKASFPESKKLTDRRTSNDLGISADTSHGVLPLPKFSDEISHINMDESTMVKDSLNHLSDDESIDLSCETADLIILCDADMVEHVLLDWTLWVTAPVSIQITLLGFLERMVSMHWFRNHNLTILRRINLVQHLLVTLQRGDVEVPVLEKFVVLLGVILEDGFVVSELEVVVRFIIMTFSPPELTPQGKILRETMGIHVIVRNMLLEMLIDLQVTIHSEELLEQWHKLVSSRLITFFLDEAVHSTTMRWILTLLAVSLTSSATFVLKFRTSGGFQGLTRTLPCFYDSPEIYYILFCLVFRKPVYPRVPEVRLLDFFDILPSEEITGELKFVELLDTVVAMAKATFDGLTTKAATAHQDNDPSHLEDIIVADLNHTADMGENFQGEALLHKTYAARLMNGEAAAPAVAASILRFMIDLAKTCPSFSAVCRRSDFLESCVDLYFSCVRSDCALKMAKGLTATTCSEGSRKIVAHADSTRENFSGTIDGSTKSVKKPVTDDVVLNERKSTSSVDIGLEKSPSVSEIEGDSMDMTPSKYLDSESKEDFAKMCDHGKLLVSSDVTADVYHDSIDIQDINQASDAPSSSSVSMIESLTLSEKSNSRVLTPPAGPMPSLLVSASRLGSSAGTSDVRSQFSLSQSTNESEISAVSPSIISVANTLFPVNFIALLEIDNSGYGGGPCSAGATATLDFIAQILAGIVLEQHKSTIFVENILESVPLHVNSETALVFQGLCLSRLMNFVERRILRDEEDRKKLDKSRWSNNLDAFCWIIVDRVYIGSFPLPLGVLRTLEFLLSMLQLANKDGRIEDAVPGKGILSIGRGSRQLDPYIHSILKNTNRLVMYCFLPPFLRLMGEDGLLCGLGFHTENVKDSIRQVMQKFPVDICTILQLLNSNKQLILCPSNVDSDLICCLSVNLIYLLRDKRMSAQNQAMDLMKYLLVHRRQTLEGFFLSKNKQRQSADILRSGFDLLLTGSTLAFFEWLQISEINVRKALEQSANVSWVQYIGASEKFPGVKIKGMEVRRKKEMGRKLQESSKLVLRHVEQMNDRRYNLELVRDLLSMQLRSIRQVKYGWILHGENEWQNQLQQLVHERGIFPVQRISSEPEWQLCPVEGPFRMRKKLERCKFRIDAIDNICNSEFEFDGLKALVNEGHDLGMSESDNVPGLKFLKDVADQEFYDADHVSYDGSGSSRIGRSRSARISWDDGRSSSMNGRNLHSVTSFGAKSSSFSMRMTGGLQGQSEIGSPRVALSVKNADLKLSEDKSEKELLDNGEYLIRPYLEPSEKIRFKFNCERVVALDKHDGIFLIGDLCLYIIENFYIDDSGCICEKSSGDELSVIDKALGVKKSITEFQSTTSASFGVSKKALAGGRAWAYNGSSWGLDRVGSSNNLPHSWHMWKLDSVNELLKRDYQLRPVAIEIFSMDGCNGLLVFHKWEREEVFKTLVAMNLPRKSIPDATVSASSKQETNEGNRLFKITAKSFTKRWQNGEISNFQYLMHLNTLAGRGYSDLTQYPVFPWVLADYMSEELDLSNPDTFRKFHKPMGCQTEEGEIEFRKRYTSWDDPDVPKFHYGSHYSSAGIVLFYLIRLPPFSSENQKLQGGQFDHADRLFNSVRDTWLSASGKSNTSDVKELVPEFFYMPEFLENRFKLDLGEKQSGEKVGDVVLPPWAKGSAREFVRVHREALESDYVSENLHHWIDLIFGYKQRGKAAEEAVNVFYHYTYEGNVDIDAVEDPGMKASILAQINHFGQTPKQLFVKPHVQRRLDRRHPPHPLRYCTYLLPKEVRKISSPVSQIISHNEKILAASANSVLKPTAYIECISWGFSDRSLRMLNYDSERLLFTYENLHGGNQIMCAGVSHDGNLLITGADDGVVAVWRFVRDGFRNQRLSMLKALCAHTAKINCLCVSQPYSLIVSGSEDCTVIVWDLTNLVFVKQLPKFPSPVSAVHLNNLTGEILTGAGALFAVWSINGDCLAVMNTSHLPSDLVLSTASPTHSEWHDTNWYVTGHQSGAIKVWKMLHHTSTEAAAGKTSKVQNGSSGMSLQGVAPEYRLVLEKTLKSHKHPVTALNLPTDLKQLLSGDADGRILSWTLKDGSFKAS